MNPDGTQLTGPITAGGENFWGRWNNLGNRIVFVSTRDSGNQEIYISGSGGQDPKRLTDNSFLDWDPSFSPDGRWIVFDSNRLGGNVDLYIMTVDGTDETRITVEQGPDQHPSWSIKTTP
jgi:Tol biopolymer transport system component